MFKMSHFLHLIPHNLNILTNFSILLYYFNLIYHHFSFAQTRMITKTNFLFSICHAQVSLKAKGHIQQCFRTLKILNVKKVTKSLDIRNKSSQVVCPKTTFS